MPKASHSRPAATAQPRLRRGYFECRYGQLHVHNAIPAGGGFEEGTPLLCLHPIPHSGRIFSRFLTVAGVGRSIFAPDLPGFGDSDPPPPRAGVTEHAAAIGDFLETMRLRQVDLLGQGFGAAVAAELAATRPAQVRRLVLVSPPLSASAAVVPPMAPALDSSHLLEEWRRAVAYCGPAAPPEVATAALAERLRNGVHAAARGGGGARLSTAGAIGTARRPASRSAPRRGSCSQQGTSARCPRADQARRAAGSGCVAFRDGAGGCRAGRGVVSALIGANRSRRLARERPWPA